MTPTSGRSLSSGGAAGARSTVPKADCHASCQMVAPVRITRAYLLGVGIHPACSCIRFGIVSSLREESARHCPGLGNNGTADSAKGGSWAVSGPAGCLYRVSASGGAGPGVVRGGDPLGDERVLGPADADGLGLERQAVVRRGILSPSRQQQGVAVDHPLLAGCATTEFGSHPGERDVDDRDIERDQEEAQRRDRDDDPGVWAIGQRRGA